MTSKGHRFDVCESGPRVALAPFLSACPEVVTLGIRPCLDDYSAAERALMRNARRIFFPTPRFIDVFQALDKPSFPTPTTYRYQHSRVLQQLLFQYLALNHPRTRIYFGRQQKAGIGRHFSLPVRVLGPHVAPATSHCANNPQDLRQWLRRYNPVLVQEAVVWEQRIQLICVHYECIAIFHQTPQGYEYLAVESPSCRGESLWEPVHLTLELLPQAQLDDILVEWGYGQGNWQLLGMSRPPRRWKGQGGVVDRHRHICGLVQSGRL